MALLYLAPAVAVAQDEAGLSLGTKAPVSTARDLDGKPVELGQWIGRKPVMLEFWAVWCENCEALLPRVKAAKTLVDDKVEFIGVAVAVNQSPERIRRYAEENGLPLRMVYDGNGTLVRAYQAPVTSYIVVLDRAGTVVYTGVGADQSFEPALRQVAGISN
jgi:peroxiredoxin